MAFGVASIEARGSPAILSAISTHDLADILVEQYPREACRQRTARPHVYAEPSAPISRPVRPESATIFSIASFAARFT